MRTLMVICSVVRFYNISKGKDSLPKVQQTYLLLVSRLLEFTAVFLKSWIDIAAQRKSFNDA